MCIRDRVGKMRARTILLLFMCVTWTAVSNFPRNFLLLLFTGGDARVRVREYDINWRHEQISSELRARGKKRYIKIYSPCMQVHVELLLLLLLLVPAKFCALWCFIFFSLSLSAISYFRHALNSFTVTKKLIFSRSPSASSWFLQIYPPLFFVIVSGCLN